MVLRLPRDTSDDAIRAQHQALRRLGLAGRAAMTFELGDNLRTLLKIGIRLHHPEWNEQQVQAAVVERLLGRDLAEQVRAWVRAKTVRP